jgi:glycosyltransferase involved in cell wall biosynthesis
MKVCQLLLSQGDGGLEKHVRDLSIQLTESGHTVSVVADKTFLSSLPAAIKRYPIPARLGRRNPLLQLLIRNTLRQINADIIHAQANKAAYVLSKVSPALTGITVGTVHNIKRDVRSFTQLDHVITVSHCLAERFKRSRTSVIYNGIVAPTVNAMDLLEEFALMPQAPVLLAVGRLVPAKGFDTLLHAVNGLKLNLVIVGDGPERRSLQKQVTLLSPATRVCLAGHRSDVASLMAAADAVLISSRREGFSYVLSEALLTGCRVLATDVPVANEVLPADLITPVESTYLFRERLVSLLAAPSHWSSLMSKPYEVAQRGMTLTAMTQHTLTTYNKLVATRC